MWYRRLSSLNLIPLALLLNATTVAAEEHKVLATRLSDLRAEVESLSHQLTEKQNDYRSQLQLYTRQESELALELQRTQSTLSKLRTSLEKKIKANEERTTQSTQLLPIVNQAVAVLERHIERGLPFKVSARLEVVHSVAAKLEDNELTPSQALNRLWSILEDELRMQRESVIHRQEISLAGQIILADLLRLGMTTMLFRVDGSRFGACVKTDRGWQFVENVEPAGIKQIAKAFDQFSKQVRVGIFELPIVPNQLLATGVKP